MQQKAMNVPAQITDVIANGDVTKVMSPTTAMKKQEHKGKVLSVPRRDADQAAPLRTNSNNCRVHK